MKARGLIAPLSWRHGPGWGGVSTAPVFSKLEAVTVPHTEERDRWDIASNSWRQRRWLRSSSRLRPLLVCCQTPTITLAVSLPACIKISGFGV